MLQLKASASDVVQMIIAIIRRSGDQPHEVTCSAFLLLTNFLYKAELSLALTTEELSGALTEVCDTILVSDLPKRVLCSAVFVLSNAYVVDGRVPDLADRIAEAVSAPTLLRGWLRPHCAKHKRGC